MAQETWLMPQGQMKIIYVAIFLVAVMIFTSFYYDTERLDISRPYSVILDIINESEYLIFTSKCKIPKLEAFNAETIPLYKKEDYVVCSKKKPLSYVTVNNNTATLYLDQKQIHAYSENNVYCYYSNVTRRNFTADPDKRINFSPWRHIENNVILSRDPVYVTCLDTKSKKEVYANTHVAITIDETIRKKLESHNNTKNKFSILFVGIDSISKLNLIRAMPKTYKFIEDNDQWIPLNVYNKMGDNTFPNIMAIMTGMNDSRIMKLCKPNELGELDKCPMLWFDFRRLGYITAFAEDAGHIGTFTYQKQGFNETPTDYYFRPYILASEKLNTTTVRGLSFCTGPEVSGERIMNLATDFAIKFKNHTTFGYFWMNTFSHNNINTATRMDHKVKDFLENIIKEGITNQSIVIFLSDHGSRYGDIRLTNTGWYEERLPFIYISFPSWFIEQYPKEYENFKGNSNRFTTPYDLHMTLKHILALSGRNYTVTKSEACPNCRSLLEEVEADRSCAEAGIEQHWCTCTGYKKTKLEKNVQEAISAFILDTLHTIIRFQDDEVLCERYIIDEVLETRISTLESLILFRFKTKPEAVYESTVRYEGDMSNGQFSVSGSISRLDSYESVSDCVHDAVLKKYCYCSNITRATD